jgi:hypothetical protein
LKIGLKFFLNFKLNLFKPTEYYYGLMSQVQDIKNKFSKVNLSYDNYKKSVAMIKVYYSNLIYKNISESPLYETFDLVGIIGNYKYI